MAIMQVVTPLSVTHIEPEGSTVKDTVMVVSLSPAYDPEAIAGAVTELRVPPRMVK